MNKQLKRDELRIQLLTRLEEAASKNAGVRLSSEEVKALLPPNETRTYEDDLDDMESGQPEPWRGEIRWLIRRDMPAILSIESARYGVPWSDEDFMDALRHRNCIGMVAEQGEDIVGFMVYELHKNMLKLLNISVAPDCRRQGIGRAMIRRMADKLHQQRRHTITIQVEEGYLGMHLWLKACGFQAVNVDGDTIEFRYTINQ